MAQPDRVPATIRQHGRAPRGPRLGRRTLVRAAGALVAGGWVAAGGSGCAGSRPTQVAVTWSNGELDLFRQVLHDYPDPVEVISAGDDIDSFLRARHLAGTSPDVAILPRPGLVTGYARLGWLAGLPESLAGAFQPAWADLLRVDGRLYGAWVKAAHKSLLWYLPAPGFRPPETWNDLVELVRTRGVAGSGTGTAPLAVGAADGWVLTDWFENVLAAIAPGSLYDGLARGEASWRAPEVSTALDLLAGLWTLPGAFPGGPRRALLTQFDASVIQLTSHRASLVFEGDFVEQTASGFLGPGTPAPAASRFPAVNGVRPLVAGGDIAVVLRASDRAERLIHWLMRPDAFDPWIRAGGYLSPLRDVPPSAYPQPLRRTLAAELRDASNLRFDLSDQLPGAFNGADGVGSWRIMQDFFQTVTAPGATAGGAVARTVGEFDRAAHGAGGGL